MTMFILFKPILTHTVQLKKNWTRYLENNLKFAEEASQLLANAETSVAISQSFHIVNKFGI